MSQEIKEKETTNNYMKIAMKTAAMKKTITSKEKLNPPKFKKQEDNIL